MRGFACAGAAYNAGIRQSGGDILVFAHQDVYLPPDWDSHLAAAVSRLCQSDPNWAVLGVFGITHDSRPHGHIYCTGLGKVLGHGFAGPVNCTSLDEVVVILRRSAALEFDEQLPGFHLYGTDICLEGQRRGFNCYIIPAFCIHNTQGMKFLPWAFWKSYLYMRHKWKERLPVRTPCTLITRSCFPLFLHSAKNSFAHYIKRQPVGLRVPDPGALYEALRNAAGLSEPANQPARL
jgi:glycosyltransferase involved in cell wall biosynthesis